MTKPYPPHMPRPRRKHFTKKQRLQMAVRSAERQNEPAPINLSITPWEKEAEDHDNGSRKEP